MINLLIDPVAAEEKPLDLFFLAFFITLLCIGISYYFFSFYRGIVSVVLVTFAFFPLLFKAFRVEEQRDITLKKEKTRFYAHKNIIMLFLFIFLGCLGSYFIAYLLLPEDIGWKLFSDQFSTIQVGSSLTGNAVSKEVALVHILQSNFLLLFICLVLSLLFGLGALFLLTWNGSIIGVAMALFAQENLASGFGMATVLSALRYLVHGVPEVLSFFLASLGGSIVCMAVLHHDLKKQQGRRILVDGLSLVFASMVLLVLSALLEVFLTPLFF